MPLLHEIPGASERSANCRIQVRQADDGTETILTIPPREAPFWLQLAATLLVVNLLLLFGTGLVLFVAHKSVLLMTQIAPGDLPLTMRRYAAWYAFGWGALVTVGVWSLGAMLRPLWLRETVTISKDGVSRQRQYVPGMLSERTSIPLSEVRGFHFQRDPQGMTPIVLTLQGRAEAWTIAEYVSEADKEWLASAGNALLRAL
jgi:hypothetical protein